MNFQIMKQKDDQTIEKGNFQSARVNFNDNNLNQEDSLIREEQNQNIFIKTTMSNYKNFDQLKNDNFKNLENLIGASNFYSQNIELNNKGNFNKITDIPTSKMNKKLMNLNTQNNWSRKQIGS